MTRNGSAKKRELRQPDFRTEPEKKKWQSLQKEPRIELSEFDHDTVMIEDTDTFSECIFDHVTINGMMKGILFADVRFRHCDFSNAVMDEAVFRRCVFENCRMLGVSMIRASLEDVSMNRCVCTYGNFNNSIWNWVSWNETSFGEAAFGSCQIKHTEIHACDFTGVDFLDTKLAELDFSDSVLNAVTVRPQDMKGAVLSFSQAELCAQLLGVQLKGY